MSTIDEIMESVYRSQVATSAYEESSGPGTRELEIDMFAADDDVRSMIAAALADARREGAREMREAAAMAVDAVVIPGYIESASGRICALPLPTGERHAVLLTDEAVTAACRDIAIAVAENCGSVPQLTHPHIYLGVRKLLATNNLEVRRD